MTVPVWVEQNNGTFTATVPGVPSVRSENASREKAIDDVRLQLRAGAANGQLVMVDVDFVGVSGLAGTYSDDPTLQEICAEAYRLRDEQKAQAESETWDEIVEEIYRHRAELKAHEFPE
jgi:hypothetical protein